jgi:hypothetical protein
MFHTKIGKALQACTAITVFFDDCWNNGDKINFIEL